MAHGIILVTYLWNIYKFTLEHIVQCGKLVKFAEFNTLLELQLKLLCKHICFIY